MQMHTLFNACLARKAWQERTHIARLQRRPLQCAEDNTGTTTNFWVALAFLEPVGEQREGSRVHADGSVAIALAMTDSEGARSHIEIAPLEGECLDVS